MDETCKQCGKVIETSTKKVPKNFCSYSCYEQWAKFNYTPNCECAVCGRKMYIKPSHIKKVKNGVTCSKKCAYILKSEYSKGEKNHQYGLIGDKNASFKGTTIISNYGYILEYCPGHPYPHDRSTKGTRVLQHRLVIERNYEKFNPEYFETINGRVVLRQCYDVHHINEDKQDNRLENLEILLRSEHTSHHNLQKQIIRDDLGRIVGVVKLGNNGESCDANPVINLEITKGSESSYSVEGE
jgi:hypothetical protein